MSAKAKTLAEMDPKPQGGEFYTVMSEGGTIRYVVMIDKERPNAATIPAMGGSSGIANYYKPEKVTKEEAGVHLLQEIKDFKESLATTIPSEISLVERCIREMEKFYAENF